MYPVLSSFFNISCLYFFLFLSSQHRVLLYPHCVFLLHHILSVSPLLSSSSKATHLAFLLPKFFPFFLLCMYLMPVSPLLVFLLSLQVCSCQFPNYLCSSCQNPNYMCSSCQYPCYSTCAPPARIPTTCVLPASIPATVPVLLLPESQLHVFFLTVSLLQYLCSSSKASSSSGISFLSTWSTILLLKCPNILLGASTG
jgi:hypothetical protein